MNSIFCCSQVSPFRARIIDNEARIRAFLGWVKSLDDTPPSGIASYIPWDSESTYVIQVARQVNYGTLEWKRYFVLISTPAGTTTFHEVKEQDLIDANFAKVNAYVNNYT